MSQTLRRDRQMIGTYLEARSTTGDLTLREIEAFERLSSTQLDLLYIQESAAMRRATRRERWLRRARSFVGMMLEGIALSSVPASAAFTLTVAAGVDTRDAAPVFPFPWGFGFGYRPTVEPDRVRSAG